MIHSFWCLEHPIFCQVSLCHDTLCKLTKQSHSTVGEMSSLACVKGPRMSETHVQTSPSRRRRCRIQYSIISSAEYEALFSVCLKFFSFFLILIGVSSNIADSSTHFLSLSRGSIVGSFMNPSTMFFNNMVFMYR